MDQYLLRPTRPWLSAEQECRDQEERDDAHSWAAVWQSLETDGSMDETYPGWQTHTCRIGHN